MIPDVIALVVVLALAVLFGWLAKRAWGSKRRILKWPALVVSGLLTLIFALMFVVAAIGVYELYIPPTTSGTKTPTVWLCRPGLSDNPCEADQTATIVRPDGTTSVQAAMPAKDPPIDCFYVYPAVSQQLAVNADLTIGAEEREVAILQASRFSQVCQVYYTAQCMNSNGASWLQINDIAGPGDHRWVVHPSNSQTGLHIYDLNLALGNLVTLVGDEAAAYTR